MATTRPGITRRRVLVGLLLAPPALSACSLGTAAPAEPDPLQALADAARRDAATATAAITAAPDLAGRVQPLVDARSAHAAALDTEIARLDPDRGGAPTTTPAAPVAPPAAGAPVTLDDLRKALTTSGEAAAAAAMDMRADRVGLVASIAACCSTYAEVLV